MPIQLLLAFLIVGALDEDLEADLGDQLEECTNILNSAQSFYEGLPNFNYNRRRLADSEEDGEELEDEVEKSLDTCMAVVQSVNNFYKELGDDDAELEACEAWRDPIVLNVGGTYFPTTLATLRSKNGTFFEKTFRNASTTSCSADGTFFIDRNPENFEYNLKYLRRGDLLVEGSDTDLRSQLLEDAEFFEFPEELKGYLRYSALAGIDLRLSELSWLNKELPGNYKMGGLLFDTAKDGDAASTFHARCDGEGPTVTIVETTLGVMFGGFTEDSWSSTAGYRADAAAFVFRLRPSKLKFKVSSSSYAIYPHPSYGPRFGGSAFNIYSGCKSNAKSFVGSSAYYNLGSYVLNDGHYDFRVKEYAVVQAVA